MTEQQTAAMRQALEALELEDMACRYEKEPTPEHIANAITALRQALEQAEQEPVVCKHEWFRTGAMQVGECRCIHCGEWKSSTPVERQWVDLTDDEIAQEFCLDDYDYARAVIAAFKEKNK